MRAAPLVADHRPHAEAGADIERRVCLGKAATGAAPLAIDPATGGVLAFISKPGYDPNLFIDGIDSQSWKDLNEDHQNPLVNWAFCAAVSAWFHLQALHGSALIKFREPNYTIPTCISLPGSTHRFQTPSPPAGAV